MVEDGREHSAWLWPTCITRRVENPCTGTWALALRAQLRIVRQEGRGFTDERAVTVFAWLDRGAQSDDSTIQ